MWRTQSSWCRAGSSEQTCRVLRVDGSIDCAILQGSFDEFEVPAPYKAKVSSLEGAAGVLISSSSDPLEISSTSVAMRGASPSTINSDVSLAALMPALSLRADLPRAGFLVRLATTRATAGFNRLPVFVELPTSLARDTALARSLEKDATKVSGGSLNAPFSARSIKRPVRSQRELEQPADHFAVCFQEALDRFGNAQSIAITMWVQLVK